MQCPYCGQEHPNSIQFCPKTGRKLNPLGFCPSCGAATQESWSVCPNCGNQLFMGSQAGSSECKRGSKDGVHSRVRIGSEISLSILILAALIYIVWQRQSLLPPRAEDEIFRQVSSSEGGIITLSDQAAVKIPPGALPNDGQISLQKFEASKAPGLPAELESVGSAYLVQLGPDRFQKQLTLEVPFDPNSLPYGMKPEEIFLSYYDESKEQWAFAGGVVETSRHVIILETSHASWWMPTSWNWSAWIAILSKMLRVSIVDWIEAVKLLVDDCPQTGTYVQVDSRQSRNVVQGCIEQDDAERPGLRVVNPKSFFFEVQPVSGGNGYPEQMLLSPGEDLNFEASTDDPSPLVIEASITQKSGWYLVVHMVLTMLPGANQLRIQGKQVACITERLADLSYFADAAEALIVEQNGAAAAESLSSFMLDGDAVRRFISAADDCNFGPARTWSVEGIRQLGGAVSTIMSATDYVANYFAGNTQSHVSFIWDSELSPATATAEISIPQITIITPQSPQPVGICATVVAQVTPSGNFGKLRIKFANEAWQEATTTEIKRTFCTNRYEPGVYKIRVEASEMIDIDWSHPTVTEADYEIKELSYFYPGQVAIFGTLRQVYPAQIGDELYIIRSREHQRWLVPNKETAAALCFEWDSGPGNVWGVPDYELLKYPEGPVVPDIVANTDEFWEFRNKYFLPCDPSNFVPEN